MLVKIEEAISLENCVADIGHIERKGVAFAYCHLAFHLHFRHIVADPDVICARHFGVQDGTHQREEGIEDDQRGHRRKVAAVLA